MKKNGVNPIPPGMHSVTPHLVVRGAAAAVEFYKKAFGATEVVRMPMPGGDPRLMHAEVKIGDSHVFLADEFPEFGPGSRSPQALGGSPVTVSLYVEDADAVCAKAVAAGATVTMPLMDAFWGDRYGKIKDPFGHEWALMTHIEDVPPEEMAKRAEAAFAGMGEKHN